MTEIKTNLAGALVKFQSVVPVIPKNKTAKITMKSGGTYSYQYADLADIWEAIRIPLKDNGLAVTQMLKSTDTTDFIVTKIWFGNGETESQDFAIPTSGKTPQEVGSVITYYKRYALGAALGISTEEDDDGKSGNSKPEPKPTPVIRDRAQEQEEAEVEILAKAKKTINTELEKQDYTRADSKKAFIKKVLEKETIDTLDDADLVMDALENEQKDFNNELLENPIGE